MYFKRVTLFVLANVAVLLVLAVVLQLLGVEQWLAHQGVGIDFWGLLLFATLIGFGGSFISLAISKWLAKRTTGMVMLEQPRTEREMWLYDTVHRLSRDAGIQAPELGIYDSPDPNAFATGARRDHALVAVSTGLLRGMSREEVEAVLAHEISHVANGDMVTLALLQGVLNTFVIFLSRVIGMLVDRVVFRQERGYGPGYWITTILAQITLGILASIIVFWFSRRREFRADAGSAALLGPVPMIQALRRLQQVSEAPSDLPDNLRAFGIRGEGGLTALFRSHPPLDERIAALEERRFERRGYRPVEA